MGDQNYDSFKASTYLLESKPMIFPELHLNSYMFLEILGTGGSGSVVVKVFNKTKGDFWAMKIFILKKKKYQIWEDLPQYNSILEEKYFLQYANQVSDQTFLKFQGSYQVGFNNMENEDKISLILAMEYGVSSLKNIIEERRNKKKDYSESEILIILQNLPFRFVKSSKFQNFSWGHKKRKHHISRN